MRVNQEIINAVVQGLHATYQLHENLGEAGRSNVQLNPFGETALVMDIRAEEALLASFKNALLSYQVFSEEHGTFIVGQNPQYLVVIDGLDGSNEYKKRRGLAMYGTMAGILVGSNPCYDDYLVSGIMIHSPSPKLFLAIKNQGCFLVNAETNEKSLIPKRKPKTFSSTTPIELDLAWEPFKILSHRFFNLACPSFSQAAHTAKFVEGIIDVELEWTRKGNLEQAVSFGLATEAGGVMISPDGKSIGSKHFKTFGQNTHLPLIIATDPDLAKAVCQNLNLRNLHS